MCRSTQAASEPGERDGRPGPRPGPETVVIRVTGRVSGSEVPTLCAELGARIDETRHDGATPVEAVCDVAALPADLAAVEAVARLHLTARRHGARLHLHDVRPELRELLHLVGLGCLTETAELPEEPG
ncbi:STAS domain-containing protein [Streptomyces sp. NPDC020412]|uniref:STAS domain-containing protein n=1 Tax=Streptomyces sp. NPDC020412 TaxID=3365073 RepID=UPI0037B613D7